MSIALTLLTERRYIEAPQGLVGWLAWLLLSGIVILSLLQLRDYRKNWKKQQWGIFTVLAVLVPLTSLFIIMRLPSSGALTPPEKPIDTTGPALAVFAAIPWVFAAGLLGPWPAAGLAFASGTLLSIWDTHSPFTPLEMALIGLVLSSLLSQRYRTIFYRTLRHPLASTALLSLIYPLLYLADTLFVSAGSLVTRLDYALTHVKYTSLATGGELLLAGMFAEVFAISLPAVWGGYGPLRPSPSERKLETRFFYSMAPLALLLLIVLMVGDWIVAGNSSRQLLRERMGSTAQMASETMPYFLQTGQNLIQKLAQDARLYNEDADQLSAVLEQDLHIAPYFRQLYLLDKEGEQIAAYPAGNYLNSGPTQEEQAGIDLARNGLPIQSYTIPPVEGGTAAQISFLASIMDELGMVRGVLVGRSDLASNPLTQPLLSSIKNMVGIDGEGLLLDDKGRILFDTSGSRLMENYTGRISEEAMYYDDAAPDGTRRLVYYQPVQGYPWKVVLAVPARRAQQMALDIAAPLLGMLILLFLFAVFILRFGLRMVTSSLQTLGLEANRISSGQLDHSLPVDGEDEVGQLRRAFEQMRLSLKARMDELNCLLVVSQGVASSLEMKEAVQPVLEAALSLGASSARVALAPAAIPETDGDKPAPSHFGVGPLSDNYSYLDEQVLMLNRQQEQVILNNVSRVRLLNIPPGLPRPEAILALALGHENMYYGTLWLAYDKPHQFTDEEIRFLVTLASQAALAAANARLFQSAEIGRQRLAAILDSSPDPVLVTDQQNRLLLANPAAWQVLSLGAETLDRQPIEQITTQKELLNLLRSKAGEKQTSEITFPDGRVFQATASIVSAEGHNVGRVCVLRDITSFKRINDIKTEFVATVSHDLRSPLTQMRGYSTLLEMSGNLNDQQAGYVRKIVNAVEKMSHLVNNLLDVGRIEAGIDLQLEMVLVNEMVEHVVGNLQLEAAQKRITLNVDIPPQTTPLIEVEPGMLEQALSNLVQNAIKYNENGGKVTVRVESMQDGLLFTVSDTGKGIAPVDQSHLFEKFFRGAQQDTQKEHGTGLGLAIVKSIAERHNGKVWLESQLGRGSKFFLWLPLRQPKREVKGQKSS